MRLFRLAAQQAGMRTEALEGAMAVLHIALERGLAESDYSAIFEAIVVES